MSFSGIFITIILLGSIQGFIISSLLFFSKDRKLSGRLLGSLIFLIALASLNIYLNTQPWFVYSGALQVFHALVPWVMVMPMGPLIYFYLHSLLEPDFNLSNKKKRHFYPVLLDIIPQLVVMVFLVALAFGLDKNTRHSVANFIDTYNVYSDIPRWLSVTYYILLSFKYLADPVTKNRVEANGQISNYKWLKQFIRLFMGFQIIWLFHLIPYIIPATRYQLLDAVDWYPVYVPLTILIYVLGIRGYLQMHKINTQIRKDEKLSSLPETLVAQTVHLLQNSMEQDKLYQDPALNLSALAKHTGLPPKTISAVLNQHLHKSFNEFINEYRILEIKERLLQPGTKNLTIAGLAYECGFNSQPTFQRAFKAFVGISPKEFISKEQKTSKTNS